MPKAGWSKEMSGFGNDFAAKGAILASSRHRGAKPPLGRGAR